MRNYREFLRMLSHEPGAPTLFEPYPSHNLITQIIWRAGNDLFNTVESKVSTLMSFYDNIGADTVTVKADSGDIDRILEMGHKLPAGLKFTILSDDKNALAAAEKSDFVCALATKNQEIYAKDFTKPMIFIAGRDVILGIENSIERGFAGVYISENFEILWKRYNEKIAILGGISDSIISSASTRIYDRVRTIYEMTNGNAAAIGTGLYGVDADYLGFISMLYMYNTLYDGEK